jgi:transcriptional regulator with XRE-family HTH domain
MELAAPITPFFLARTRRRWKQADVAAMAGVTTATVSRVERGEPASHRAIVAIARALELTDAELGAALRAAEPAE